MGGRKFSLTLRGRVVEGVLGDGGELVEPIEPDEKTGELVVCEDDDIVYQAHLHFGHLDPIERFRGFEDVC